MSREELSSKYKKYTTTSNESMNRMETGPIKTNQSLNSSSYEYFSQKITTKNNITESSVNSLNQNTNSKYMQTNVITSGQKCTCNNNQKSELKCICPQGVHNAKCICGLYGKNLLEQNKITSSNSKMSNELKINEEMSGKKIYNCSKGKEKQIEITSKINVNSISNSNAKENRNANININLNSKNAKVCNCNKGGIHTNINQTQSQAQTQICNCNKGSIHSSNINQAQAEAQICNCNKGTIHTTNIKQTQTQTQNQNKNQISSVRKVENYSYLSSNKNSSSDVNTRITQKTTITKTKININKNVSKAEWNKRCVDQNNENLQIIAPEKPQLIAQCVQEMQVIQKPMPVQILLPIEQNEIDYPLGLEIYGKKKEEKKVLICPENIENLNVSKAYSTIVPQFENLNISKTEDVFCERTVTEKKEEIAEEEEEVEEKVEEVEEKEEEEPKEVMVDNNLKEKRYDNTLISKNNEIAVKGKIFDFNKDNKAEVITNMNVSGKTRISWNDTNEGIKTTKLNIETEGGFSTDKFDLFLNKSVFGKFDNLHIENNTYNYDGIPPKKKYSSSEANIETNDEIEYPAEYTPSNWNEIAEPMSGRPFTIRTQKNWPLFTTKGDKLTLKYAYRTKDWNKLIKTRREVQINMAIRKRKKGALSKQRVQPVIIKGTNKNKNNWNDIIKKQKESNIKINKTEKEDNNFTFAKGDEVFIENQSDEILVNDDYNIVEQNYTRPIRANIHKVQEYSEEESKSSDYNVLNGIEKYQGQIIYKDLINQSLKIQRQKVIINDISGKYPRKTETFQGLDEHYEKYANDQYQRNRNVRINIKKSAKTENINKYYVQNKIIKREIKTQTIEQGQQPKVVIQSQVRKITYEPEHEDEYEHEHEQQKIQIQENYYQKQESHSSEQNNNINNDNNINNNNEPEDEQEEEQENMDAPEDEDHIPEEKIAQNQQIRIQSQEAEDNNQEQDDEHEHDHEQDIEEQYHEGENEEHEAEAEAEGEAELENEEEHNKYSDKHQIETQEQYYYLKKSEEKISNEQEQEQENMNEQEQNEEEEVKDSLQKSAEILEQKKEIAEKEEPKVYIKEITFTKKEESPEENRVKLRYITLKKKEEQEDSNSQPNDQVQEDIKHEEQEIEKREENIEQQNEVEENIVTEKEIKEENIEKGQSTENIQQQYITMQSQKVDEQHISKSENDIKSDLDKEIDKYEEEEKLKQIREKELINQEIPQDEEYHEVKDNIQNEEEVDNEIEEEIKRKQEILENEKNIQENIQMEGQAEEHFVEHGEEHSEAHAEQHSKENMEEHSEAHAEQHSKENMEEHSEAHAEQHSKENMEEHAEENMEENIEQQEKENIEITQENNQENEQIQKEEIYKEKEIQNKININQKDNTISNIVANAIKVEMQAQEAKEESESKAKRLIAIQQRQRKEQEQNSNSIQHSEMVDKYSKYIRENPIYAHGQNTINIMSKVSGKEAQTQKVTLSQVISPEKQNTQNQVTQTIIVQENTNPMMYSFGQGSIEGSNLSNSKKKSSDIIISGSMTNNNMLKGSNITFAPKGLSSTQYIMNSGISSTSGNNLISSGQNISETKMIYSSKSNMQSNAGNLSGKYYFTTSHNTTTTRVVNKKKEPMDTDKRRRRMIEREMKAEYEIDSLEMGPRDSKRK